MDNLIAPKSPLGARGLDAAAGLGCSEAKVLPAWANGEGRQIAGSEGSLDERLDQDEVGTAAVRLRGFCGEAPLGEKANGPRVGAVVPALDR